MKNILRSTLLIFAILLLSALPVAARSVKTYTVADGLLDSSINCVYQDDSGIIWFGSNKGITRFDGINFKSFETRNADKRVKVLAIFQDSEGAMWVVTEVGVKLWAGSKFVDITTHFGITSFCLDQNGNRWLGTKKRVVIYGEGLDEVEAEMIKKIKGVTALYKDTDSNIWIGTDSGVYRYDGREVDKFTSEDGLAGNKVNAIYDDGENIIFGTDGGVSFFNGRSWTSYTKKDGLVDDYVTSIFRDFRGKYWFGTKNGLSIFDDSSASIYDAWSTMTTEESLPDNEITYLYNDGSANLWIGTKNGAMKLNISFDYLTKVQGVKESLFAPVFYDSEKRLWIAMEGGVTQFNNNEYERLKEEDGIIGNVTSIYEDSAEGYIYFGSDKGVSVYDGDSVVETLKVLPKKKVWKINQYGVDAYMEVFPEKDAGLVGKKIIGMFIDADGDKWIASDMALNRLSASEWTTFTNKEGLLHSVVRVITQDDDGMFYLGTERGMNTFYDDEIGEAEELNSNLPHKSVLSLLKDSKGNLWYGTKNGVAKYDGEEYRTFTLKDGLAGDEIREIFEDSRGHIWFATEGGLSKYDGENFSIYTTVDGLSTNEVLSIAEDKEGLLWFGTASGVMRYMPDVNPPTAIVKNPPTAPVVIPKYAFDVTGADLNTNMYDLYYSFKLDDDEWTAFKKMRTVFYATDLPNGSHKFSVRTKDKALNVSKPLEVSFEVNTKMFDIEIVDISFKDVFPALYQYYNENVGSKEKAMGSITLKNSFDKPLKVKVSTMIKGYMDFSVDTRAKIKPNQESVIPLGLEFNDTIMDAPPGRKKVNISIQYSIHGDNKVHQINSSVMIYDKNTISWDDPRKVGAFVSSTDEVVNSFVRSVTRSYKDEAKSSIIYANLFRAMVIYDSLGAHGIKYIADPTNPYTGLQSKGATLDTLRYPKQTLELKSGDCDDNVVLYCAMLENIGIHTAMVDTYDHLFMMFDVGLKKKDLGQITEDASLVYIDENDQVWIPVETTMFGKTFTEAWLAGAKKFNSTEEKRIYKIEDAWEAYPPADITSDEAEVAKLTPPAKEAIDKIYASDIAFQKGMLLHNLVARYEARIKADPNDTQAHNSLGVIYGKSGYLDKAEESFKRVIALKPEFAGGHSNYGNILFEKEYYNKAVDEYKKALILKPDNANIYIELAIAYSMMDDFKSAKKAYLNAIKIDPGVESR